jgi:type VI secretion system secreted protein VgrG
LGSAIGGVSATTIAAPGAGLTAPTGASGTSTVEGTSFAGALVTGGVTLLQDIYVSRFGTLPTVAQLKTWLQQGSNPITDPVTGITLGELNISKAASLIPQGQAAPPVVVAPVVKAPAPVRPVVVPQPTTTAPVTQPKTSVTSTANVQVFLNGQQIVTNGSTSASGSGSLNQASFEQLLEAMSVWAANPSSESTQSATQVQIWNA